MRISDWSSDVCSSDLEGFQILRMAATRYWSPEAMAMVAEAYRDGLGTRADPIAAEHWFRRAVDAGSVTAKLEYGRMLVERKDDRSEARRVGNECGRTCRSRGSP